MKQNSNNNKKCSSIQDVNKQTNKIKKLKQLIFIQAVWYKRSLPEACNAIKKDIPTVCNLFKKDNQTQVLYCEFYVIFKDIFHIENLTWLLLFCFI